MEENLSRPDDYISADLAFHKQVATIAGNRFYVIILEVLTDYLRDFIEGATQTREHREESLDWHRKITACLKKGQVKKVIQAMQDHLSTCGSSGSGEGPVPGDSGD